MRLQSADESAIKENAMLLAHADHPELFFAGLVAGFALVILYRAYESSRGRKR